MVKTPKGKNVLLVSIQIFPFLINFFLFLNEKLLENIFLRDDGGGAEDESD